MKKLSFLLILFLAFILASCKKNEEGPTSPSLTFDFNPQLNKQYTFQYFQLDSLNNPKNQPIEYYHKILGKNLLIGGKNDAILIGSFYNAAISDSFYIRVENGKDIYQYEDTTGFIFESRNNFKYALQKKLQNYYWLPVALLSKGDGVEYSVLPKRFYTVPVDTNFILNVSQEVFIKNEGFETVSVPAGSYKAYKVKVNVRLVPYLLNSNQPLDTINVLLYRWYSDDIDWWVKEYSPSIISKVFGLIGEGQKHELISVQ
jgi:hypothetical protein